MKPPKPLPANQIHAPTPVDGFNFQVSGPTGLFTLSTARLLLGKTTETINAWIEEGRIRWAFDISSERAVRCEVRILRQSLLQAAGLVPKPAQPAAKISEAEEFRAEVEANLPHGFLLGPATISATEKKLTELYFQNQPPVVPEGVAGLLYPKEPVLRGADVMRILSCGDKHVARLLAEGSLKASKFRRGHPGKPLIFRHSLMQFLKERRIT